ncbi:phage tail protein [Oryzobacter terrae]|uniref:phage tail protein n=1 Tax=Oryzobacter terrae TaxID=1620385 RepID=UPI00366EE9B7
MDADPLGASGFEVELGDAEVGCSEVTGLVLEPGAAPTATVTLRRGVTGDGALLEWARRPEPRRVTITVLDARREPAARYVLVGARPVRWTGPTLDALSVGVAVEELVLGADEVRPG